MTITLTREEAQQVLDALENFCEYGAILKPLEVRDLLRARLAQPEPEPVTKCTNSDSWNCKYCRKTETCAALKDPRNFAPPKKEWQGLTHEEIAEESGAAKSQSYMVLTLAEGFFCGARWAEAKLKERNA